MTTTTLANVSPADYLEAERKSDFKHEYLDGIVIPMSGASWIHTIITNNISALLWLFIKNEEALTVHSSDLKIFSPAMHGYFYPDVVVVKGEPHLTDTHADTITNPSLIIEVLLNSTEGYDRGDKFRAYRAIESLQEYVLVSQHEPFVEVFVRQDDGWYLHDAKGMTQTIRLQTLSYDLSLAEVYAKVKFGQC